MAKSTVDKNKNLNFNKFCKACFSCMDADSKVAIKNKFLSDNILKVFSDVELCESLKSFFENNLNISETSRNTFVHRNTLVYRLDKIQKLTGLDVRNFEDALCFRLYMWLKDE